MEDLFTAVLSPSTSQSSQLAQSPNTIPNVPVMTVPQQGPGIFSSLLGVPMNRRKNYYYTLRYDLLKQLNHLGFSFR